MLKTVFASSSQRKLWLKLAFVIGLVYLQVLTFSFVNWDDNSNISGNPEMIFSGWASYKAYWSGIYAGLFAPIPFTVWTLLAQFSQILTRQPYPVPMFYHALNVLVHMVNSALVFALLYELLNSPDKSLKKKELAEFDERRSWAALIGAALFALHPLQVESVAWITGFKDVSFGLFSLLTVFFILRDRMKASSFTYLLALLSKPTAVILPALAVWLLVVSGRKVTRRQIYFFAAWLVAAVPVFVFTRAEQGGSPFTFFPTFWQKIVVAYDAISFYISKILLPYPLVTDYSRNPKFVLEQGMFHWSWFVLFVMMGLALTPQARRWRLPQGLLWLVITIAPVLGFVPFGYQITSTVADRYVYLGMLGMCLPLARFAQEASHRLVKPALLGVLGVLALTAWIQVGSWRDSETLFTHVVDHVPKSLVARTQLGAFYFEGGNYDIAERVYREQIEVRPDDVLAYQGLSRVLGKTKRKEESVQVLQKLVSIRDDSAETHTELAEELMDLERAEEARAHLQRARVIDPHFHMISYLEGNLLAKEGKYELAAEKYRDSLAYQPNSAEAHNNLGNTLAIMKDIQGAQRHFAISAKLSPKSSAAHLNLARTLLMTGQFQDAYSQLQYVLQLEPSHQEAHQLLEEMKSRLPGIR